MSSKAERRRLRRNCIKAKLKANRANTKSCSSVSSAWDIWLPLPSLQFFGKWQYLRGLAGAASLVELWYLFSMTLTPCIVPSIWLILSNICWWSWRTLKAICTQPSSNPPGLALDTVVTLVCAVPKTHSDFPESSPCISAPSHHIPLPFQLIKSYYSSVQIHHSVGGLGSRLASLKLERWFGA